MRQASPELVAERSWEEWERSTLALEPRSAYLLRGPARAEWEHSIPETERLRYSVTLRTLRSILKPAS